MGTERLLKSKRAGSTKAAGPLAVLVESGRAETRPLGLLDYFCGAVMRRSGVFTVNV